MSFRLDDTDGHSPTAQDPGDPAARLHHLRRGGTSLVARTHARDVPCIVHWGPDLGELAGPQLTDLGLGLEMPGNDHPVWPHPWVAVLPRQTDGWLGRPGLRGSRSGRAWALTFNHVTHEVLTTDTHDLLRSVAVDQDGGVEVTTEVELLNSGLVRVRAIVRNLHTDPYEVTHLEPALPVPAEANELLDLAGSPNHERVPQRRAFDQGQWVRESWGGRPGHDSATVLCAGQPGFGFRSGRVWGIHLAWSGNQVLSAESSYTGWKLLRGGEILEATEIRLRHEESYSSPWLCGSWGEGLDAFSARFHDFVRDRDVQPMTPRPVVLNTWEAAFFDLEPARLTELAEQAADLGVERFVLDDGWYQGRRDDTRGLGDWTVDPEIFPDGLAPLAKLVQSLGMEFALWFEPEMVNLDSNLARAHPDWVMSTHAGPGITSRNQHVLDLTNEDAWQHVINSVSTLVAEHDIAAIKWDHNRPLTAPGSGSDHHPAAHAQTLAVYRMMAELRSRHPGLEIESCCGGGGRLDLGILEHTCRVWPSDVIDPHERHRITRWTGLTLPLETLGTHIGSAVDHATGRQHTLHFRAGTALWGHMGLELDLTKITEVERAELRTWIDLYKRHRALLHTGKVVHADRINPALQLEGVVAQDGTEGLYRLSALEHSAQFPPGRVPLPGLLPDALYSVTLEGPAPTRARALTPAWAATGITVSGRTLDEVGVMAPIMKPDELVLLRACQATLGSTDSVPL